MPDTQIESKHERGRGTVRESEKDRESEREMMGKRQKDRKISTITCKYYNRERTCKKEVS